MTEDELELLRTQAKEDRKLIEKAAMVLGEIDRAAGLRDDQADVLAALRIRLDGKDRGSLEDLLTAAGDIGGGRDLGSALSEAEGKTSDPGDWPVVEEKKKEWPGL